MKLRGSLLVIVCCLVMEFCDINQKEYLIHISADLMYKIWFLIILGLLFLLYPLVGHLTDIYLTRYRSLKWSFGFLILTIGMGAIYASFVIAVSIIKNIYVFQSRHAYLYVVTIILFLVYTVEQGLFQANAIQFGLDQLLEAPTPKLISFIHWYYWAQNVGSLAFFYAATSSVLILDVTDEKTNGTISKLLNGNVYTTVFVCFLITVSQQ